MPMVGRACARHSRVASVLDAQPGRSYKKYAEHWDDMLLDAIQTIFDPIVDAGTGRKSGHNLIEPAMEPGL